jgi:hypothetical protein
VIFWSKPSYLPPYNPTHVRWTSWGGPPIKGGGEIDNFVADVYLGGGGYGHVKLEYNNPHQEQQLILALLLRLLGVCPLHVLYPLEEIM